MNDHQKFYSDVTASLRSLRIHMGQNIRSIRQQKRMPLKKLARLSRLHPDTIDHLELGKGEINLTHIIRLAVAMDVAPEKLLVFDHYEER